MDLKTLRNELSKSIRVHSDAETQLNEHIQDELLVLGELLSYLMPILNTEEINGQKAVLIYVFENSTKKTISNKVYFCEDGKIRYQVFNKDDYRNFNPTVEYEGSYAVIPASNMFRTIDLSDVVNFFIERVETLPAIAEKISESVNIRKSFVSNFKRMFKSIE